MHQNLTLKTTGTSVHMVLAAIPLESDGYPVAPLRVTGLNSRPEVHNQPAKPEVVKKEVLPISSSYQHPGCSSPLLEIFPPFYQIKRVQ